MTMSAVSDTARVAIGGEQPATIVAQPITTAERREEGRLEGWSEYMLPRGRPAVVHYLRMVADGSVFAIYHTECALVLLAAAGLLALAAEAALSTVVWLVLPLAVLLGGALTFAGWRQSKRTIYCGIYTFQPTLSGRAYVRGDRRIGPYEELLDMHVGLAPLRAAFMQRYQPTKGQPGRNRLATRALYLSLLQENLEAVAEAFLSGDKLDSDRVVRCRMYMHPHYVPWMVGTETQRCLLREGSARNHNRTARSIAKLIQWSAEGLRISQIQRNLLFKPHKLFKTFPTRTCIILPSERLAFIERAVANGYLAPRWLQRATEFYNNANV